MMSETIPPIGEVTPVDGEAGLRRALAAIASDGREVLVDFDHTLFSSNSTELFLASARPAFVASILLGLVRGALPWYRYSSRYGRLRDYMSIAAIICVMPWTLLTWRRNAPALFSRYGANAVSDALREVPTDRVVVVSFGLTPLIRALLRGSPWEACRLISVPIPCHPRLLVTGKLDLVKQARPAIEHASAVFVTDSEDDRDLLDAVATGYLIPRQGDRVLADARLYLPWRYTSLGKYGRAWTLELVLYTDAALVLLGTGVIASGSAWMLLGTAMLFTSLHAIYEIGYHENDFHAAANEAQPVLIDGAELFRGFPLEQFAWIWAATLGVMGCLAVTYATGALWLAFWQTCLAWAGVLAATRTVFHAYNRMPVERRVPVYPFLQVCKSFGLLAILPATSLGVALISAQVLTMWINYTVYRLSGLKGVVPIDRFRLVIFVVLGIGTVLAHPAALAETGPMAVACMLGWLAWRIYRRPFRKAASRLIRRS